MVASIPSRPVRTATLTGYPISFLVRDDEYVKERFGGVSAECGTLDRQHLQPRTLKKTLLPVLLLGGDRPVHASAVGTPRHGWPPG